MPRPSSSPPSGTAAQGAQGAADPLAGFDAELRADLQRRLDEGSLSAAHIVQLGRLLKSTREDNDPDSIAELLDLTAGMTAEEFRGWVDERIALWNEKDR